MSHSGYFADQEDMRELVRLLKQGQMLTETAGGLATGRTRMDVRPGNHRF